jgi:ribose 5-phosphate isomerase B
MHDSNDQEIRDIVQRVVRQSMGQTAEAGLDCNNKDSIVVALGTDHGGVDLKDTLKAFLQENGYEVIDVGTHTKDSVDYPDIALQVAELVASGEACRGIIIDGAGIGSCMAANKVPGIRAALCYDYATAVNSREHNNANTLTLGAGLIGTNLAKQIVGTWLNTPFGGGRHARRVDKITAIEKRFSKDRKVT